MLLYIVHKSNLIVCPDAKNLQKIAKEHARNLNPADVFWLAPNEGAKSIQVKETLEFMERAHLSPVGDKKLFIICDAATMTIPAQNKMLKTIEDAPAQTTFLLLATSIEPILNTIRSRCVTKFLPLEKSSPPLWRGGLANGEDGVVNAACKLLNLNYNPDTLSPSQRHAILTAQAKINRNIAANCNAQNQSDLLLIALLKIKENKTCY